MRSWNPLTLSPTDANHYKTNVFLTACSNYYQALVAQQYLKIRIIATCEPKKKFLFLPFYQSFRFPFFPSPQFLFSPSTSVITFDQDAGFVYLDLW